MQQREGAADDALQAALRHAEVGAHRGGVLVVELGELGLDAGGHRDRGGVDARGVVRDRGRHLVAALVDVRDEEDGLRRQGMDRLGAVHLRRHRDGPRRAPRLQRGDEVAQPGLLGHGGAVAAPRRADDALQAALGLLEVGEDELGLDRLDVAPGVDVALGVDDVRVVVGAHDVDDRVDLADVGQELVAQPLALVRAAHQARDVVEVDGVEDDLGGADRLGHALEALVADGDDGDVRLDRRERVVRRLGARPGQGVEERGLARVGHPDDADPHRPSPPDGGAQQRARGDVGRVVDAEVDPRERHRRRGRVERRGGAGRERAEGARGGEGRRGVRAREAQRRRRGHERGQAVEPRPAAAHDAP